MLMTPRMTIATAAMVAQPMMPGPARLDGAPQTDAPTAAGDDEDDKYYSYYWVRPRKLLQGRAPAQTELEVRTAEVVLLVGSSAPARDSHDRDDEAEVN